MSKSSNDAPTLGHVDQIREIIVGEQIREFNERLEQLEGRITDRLESLQRALQKDQETRANALAKQVGALQAKLKEERAARIESLKAAGKDLADAVAQLKSADAKASSEQGGALAELQARIEGDLADLSERVGEQGSSLADSIQARAEGLDRAKLDRESLADLFAGLSETLRGDEDS